MLGLQRVSLPHLNDLPHRLSAILSVYLEGEREVNGVAERTGNPGRKGLAPLVLRLNRDRFSRAAGSQNHWSVRCALSQLDVQVKRSRIFPQIYLYRCIVE